MNALVVAVAVVVVLGLALEVVRRAREGRQTAEAHHRALDTLGQLTAAHQDLPSAPPPSGAAHQHVRVVPADRAATPPARADVAGRRGRRAAHLPAAGPLPRQRIEAARHEDGAPPVRYRFDALAPPADDPVPGLEEVAPGSGPVDGAVISAPANGAAPSDPAAGSGHGAALSGAVASLGGRLSLSRVTVPSRRAAHGRRRPARWFMAAGAAAAVTAAVVLTVLALHHSPAPATATRHLTPPQKTSSTVTTAPPPSTTVPPAQLVSSTNDTATYRLKAGAAVQLSANGTCWIEIRQNDASGPVVFEGDLQAGQTRSLTSPSWLRLGNPGVVGVSVGGHTIPVNAQVPGAPFNLQFQ